VETAIIREEGQAFEPIELIRAAFQSCRIVTTKAIPDLNQGVSELKLSPLARFHANSL